MKRSVIARSNHRTAAIATAALVLYPFGVGLPIMEVRRLGHMKDTSILEGVSTLLAAGDWVVGIVVLLCSIVLPLGKLATMLVLATGAVRLRERHRAIAYHAVEWTGRWGMLDVLVVAVLVAVLKLGHVVDVTAGPAALAFTGCVVLSLLAAASFDPHGLWESA